jgi:hypothetical protein
MEDFGLSLLWRGNCRVTSNERAASAAGQHPTPARVSPQYYQTAFEFLHRSRRTEIEQALLVKPAQLRSEIIGGLVASNVVFEGPVIWPTIRTALDKLEHEMRVRLEHRSTAFWLHLYRRVGVHLHRDHDDKTDVRTVELVREIVELAICKYGIADLVTEFAPSTHLNVKKVLGGVLAEAIKNTADKPYSALKKFNRYLKGLPAQWIIKDFVPEDFVALYHVEGLAYQYWKIGALLRSLGKGANVEFTDDGDWKYHTSEDFDELIVSIDQRTENSKMESSLIGVWFRDSDPQLSSTDPVLIVPVYNAERTLANDIYKSFGLHLEHPLVSNFLPATLSIRPYLEAHSEFSEALLRKHGFSLTTIILTIWAFNKLALFPFENITRFSAHTIQSLTIQYTFNLCQRAYRIAHIGGGDTLSLIRLIRMLLNTLEPPTEAPQEEIEQAIEFLRLSPVGQGQISLWSGGPRFLSIPFGDYHSLIDAHPVGAILQTLFFRVQHDATKRGSLFELEFRRALERIGFSPESGELRAENGEVRQLDAGVRVGKKLILMECVSVERPLDYEIGNPRTLAYRQQRLDEKITQALSLAEFIKSNPMGRNYAFNDIEEIVPFVVSPFYEWIWERSNRLWEGPIPRIISAQEALDYVQSSSEHDGSRPAY